MKETYLAVTLSTTLAETLAALSSSGHIDISVVWLVVGEGIGLRKALEEMRWLMERKGELRQ